MTRFVLAALLGLSVAACNTVPPPVARLPAAAPGDDILWARKDGQRMASNPQLYEQGTRDKQRCEAEATMSGALDFQIFSGCMDRAGYRPMRRSA